MPSGLPARVAVVCTLMFGVAAAHAERRPVAVIDLSNDPKTTVELAKALNLELIGHQDLQPLSDPTIPAELVGEFRDDDQLHVRDAQTAKQAAEDQLARYQFAIAESAAAGGQRDLEQAMPSAAALQLYSQLAFVRGQALLGMPNRRADATSSFALAIRLDPGFAPDPARYLPDVVQAFNVAKRAWSGTGTLAIAGTGRLWIDGKDHGSAPSEVQLEAGPHLVWLTGADRETRAVRTIVDTGAQAKVVIDDAPADARVKVRRARASLRYAPDPAARSAAMRHIAEIVGVRDAVLLSSANGKVIVQTWNAGTRDQTPGFSALRELRSEKPLDLLTPLAPPRPKVDPIVPIGPVKPPVDTRRWYERRSIQVGLMAAVFAAVITGYYVYNAATDDTVTWNPDVAPVGRIRF